MVVFTIYLDQVFIGNLIMNYVILWAAAKLGRTPAGKVRVATGAALGAAYSLALFIPGNDFLFSVWVKTAASVLIIAVTFAPLPIKKFLACLGYFYLTSFVLGGLIFGMVFFIQPGRVSGFNGTGWVVSEYFWPGLLLGLAAFGAVCQAISTLFQRRILENLFKLVLLIKLQGVQVEVDALLDTGNQLEDPMTKRAVIVVEYDVLKPILPGDVRALFERDGEPDVWHILSCLGENPWRSRFSVIPFNSLGLTGGLMVGFRPDEVSVMRQGQPAQVKEVIIAIYHKKMDIHDSYHALMHPRLLEIT
ncbi:MAG: Sporulation factor SpoIIGA [Pelotomaculum sp. PtaU1.Bin035]|nr:MAG: Sporulation factor SpoIIGA [Pelotomaculum sp. PtaU1.Bin035]